jgi:hypothetical protein
MPSVKNCSQFSAAHLRPSKIVGKTVENHALPKIVPYSPGFPHQAAENTWAARNRKFLYSRPPDPLTRPRPLTSTFHFVPPSTAATPRPPTVHHHQNPACVAAATTVGLLRNQHLAASTPQSGSSARSTRLPSWPCASSTKAPHAARCRGSGLLHPRQVCRLLSRLDTPPTHLGHPPPPPGLLQLLLPSPTTPSSTPLWPPISPTQLPSLMLPPHRRPSASRLSSYILHQIHFVLSL